jgi:hypothetical protein
VVLTAAQLLALKNDIAADPALASQPLSPDGAFAIAAVYNSEAASPFWVWRTSVTESEYTRQAGVDTDGVTPTNWSWTTYIGRSQGERDAWPRLFMGGGTGCNPSLANVRQAFADIFSGAGGAAQRTHLSAVSRRKATRIEKLFSAGAGTASAPAVLSLEGPITYQQIDQARNS